MAPLGPRQSPLRGSKEKDSRDYAWAIASSRLGLAFQATRASRKRLRGGGVGGEGRNPP